MDEKINWKQVDECLIEGFVGRKHFFTIEVMSSVYLHEMVHDTIVPDVTDHYSIDEAKKRAESLV